MCSRSDHPPYDDQDQDREARSRLDAVLQPLGIFRSLEPAEESGFRAWAHANWQPGQFINPLWHPVVRDECARMEAEAQARRTR